MGRTKHAPARDMIDQGVAVALATDHNPGTSPVYSMPLVMSFACSCLRMTPGEALTAATHNAAAAIARSDRLGSIIPGKQADIVLMDALDYREIPYFMGSNLAGLVISGMRVVAQEGRPNF
jgi:imidazolonepropionase